MTADAADGAPGGDELELRLSVPSMDCGSCAEKVGTALEDVPGIASYDTRPMTGTVKLTYDDARTSPAAIVDAIEAAGYEVVDPPTGAGSGGGSSEAEVGAEDPSTNLWTSSRALKTWIAGVLLAVGLGLEFVLTGANPHVATILGSELHLADALFVIAVAIGGQEILRGGYVSAKQRSLDIDFLMSTAILGALVASLGFGEALYFEAATLAVLFSIAELLETASMQRARSSFEELVELSPDQATVRREPATTGGSEGSERASGERERPTSRDTGSSATPRADGEAVDGEEVTVPVDELELGDVVVVRPGEQLPTDGEVIEGESAVNQAPITGESVPVDKTVGDEVYAGTINEEGYLEVQVTAEASDTTLSRIVELVEDAQANQTEREQFVERFASYYTPAVVAFAILVTLATPFAMGVAWSTAVVYGLTLLVLACPCAFVISTPVSVVSGITSAAKNGVLIKGGNHLEAMGTVDAVAFDKTGTLTKGELTVTDVVPLNGNAEADVLRCARGLEARSEHPIGEAIVARAGAAGVSTTERSVEEFESVTGKGVTAELGGRQHFAGKPGYFEELGFDLSHVHATTDGGMVTKTARQLCDRNGCLDLLDGLVPRLQSEGKTVVLVGTRDELEGVVAVADEVRPEAERTIAALQALGIERTVMLTGDNERTANAIAEQVGVDEFQAELLPEEKVAAVEKLDAETDGGVAMVGDGINDAPALATATVGVAMGAAGTDTALETADVALMGDDLSRLPYLYELAGDANGVIRQNVVASLAVKAGLALAVPFGLVPIWLAVLAGDAGMTIGVTGNAMRLSRVGPD